MLRKALGLPLGFTARRAVGGMRLSNTRRPAPDARLLSAPLPSRLLLKAADHRSKPAALLVREGDQVRKFQQLSQSDHISQLPLFAPACAIVSAVHRDADAGLTAIRLDTVDSDETEPLYPLSDSERRSVARLVGKIADSGVAGLGGSGAPVALKLQQARQNCVSKLIINAIECDPDISADEALIGERPHAVVQGTEILRLASGARRCVIAIGEEKQAAIAALREALAGSDIELRIMPNRYPLGEERRLVHALTGLEIPLAQSTLTGGSLCFNVATAQAVARAVHEGEPMISRVITVDIGVGVRPRNYEVLLGTPVRQLRDLSGVDDGLLSALLINGYMRGELVDDPEAVVDSSFRSIQTPAIDGDSYSGTAERSCINCGHCVSVCPARLQPQALFRAARARDTAQLAACGLEDCIDCGLCDYVCPSRIPLRQYFDAGRSELSLQIENRFRADHYRRRFQAHQERLDNTAKQPRTARPTGPVTDTRAGFSRQSAKAEIAAAVARVKARRAAQSDGGLPPNEDSQQ